MKIIKVNDKETLKMLEENSALTIEGLCEEDAEEFINWVKNLTAMSTEEIYIIKGKLMNEIYNLKGDNAYKDDLTIQAIPLNLIENVMSIVIPRFEIGARWFDDIVANYKEDDENE